MIDITLLLNEVNLRAAATDAIILAGEEQLGVKLPVDYVEFLKMGNGGEGFVGKEYLILWGIEELASMNQHYEIHKYVPRLLIFGSNGGGEAYGFDARTTSWPVVRMPFVGMEWEVAEPFGTTFNAFLEHLYGME